MKTASANIPIIGIMANYFFRIGSYTWFLQTGNPWKVFSVLYRKVGGTDIKAH
jgi:hypothetical protein